MRYGNTVFILTKNVQGGSVNLSIGNVMLTSIGEELVKLSNAEMETGFPEYLKTQFQSFGFSVDRIVES